MYAVTVRFTLKPGASDAFMPLMRDQARNSLTKEAGCHRFDILWDSGAPEEVFLYELYTDRAAFEHHMSTDHFSAFSAAAPDHVADKQVVTYDTLSEGGA
ncbi:putative quinol monooxygenase [Oceanomicrobium pacificus]|uniref:Antibiotic biosynthesis monooxygenase n=1 Tax=Oceanomicrobium pacificus TaxID=2692916 RepID=A0A6B0TRN2_9RHOB|nr:putative quinol monooxygenase [Oceanomicrobium pacificus]MXU66626.1 antibiotic biosynthesis monooxygenase [Oceanomicrobium pacificus]